MQVLVGADPELFIRDSQNNFLSAHDRVPGTKWKPFKVQNGAIQIDGTALEFNIDPAETVEQFLTNITEVRKTLESYVPGLNVVAEPVALFDESYFHFEVPDYAKTLGCDPDFNAWSLDVNPPPEPGSRPFRTAAGHVHLGWTTDQDVFDKDHYELAAKVARQCDYYLGIYSLLWDPDPTRRQLYGLAGAFRPKPYGVEYRVMSNRWLSSDHLIQWVFTAAKQAVTDGLSGFWAEDVYGDVARAIINENNVEWFNDYEIDLGLPSCVAVR